MAKGGSCSVSSSILKRLLECPVCLEEVVDPRVLPCSHSFCMVCIEKHIKSSTANDTFRCPSCRKTVSVPENGAAGIPRSFVLNTLKDGILSTTAPNKPEIDRTCVNDHDNAVKFCKECAEFYCQDCAAGHDKSRATRTHKLFAADQISEEDARQAEALLSIPKCSKHSEEELKVYCCTCELAICTLCFISKHRQHDCTDSSDISEKFKNDMRAAIEATKPFLENILSDLDDLKNVDRKIQQDIGKASALVDKTTDAVCALIRCHQANLQDQIKCFEKTARDNVEAAKQEREQRLSKLQSLYLLAEQLTTDFDITTHVPRVKGELLAASENVLKIPCMKWEADFSTQRLLLNTNLIGTCTMVQKGSVVKATEQTEIQFPLASQGRIGLCVNTMVTGIATSGKYVYVSQYNRPELSVFTPNGKHAVYIPVPGLKEPQGLAIVDRVEITLVVSDYKKKLHLINFSETVLKSKSNKFVELNYKPWGVSSARGGNMVVADRENGKIVLYKSSGQLIKEVDIATSVSKNGLVYVEATSDGYLVTDANRNQVLSMDEDCQVLNVYTGKSAPKELRAVWQAIRDWKSNVLVGDAATNRLHWVSPDLTFKRVLLTEQSGLLSPKRLCLDESNHLLYIGHSFEGAACVDIYQYTFASNSRDRQTFKFCLAARQIDDRS